MAIRRCDHCRKELAEDEGRVFATGDDWFVPSQLGLDQAPCTLCDDCVDEARGSMTDGEREFFLGDD